MNNSNQENGALGKLDGCITTFTGLKLNLTDPKPEQINIIDLAKGLAYQGHFSGQTPRFYSVAQHCLLVCDLIQERVDMARAGLDTMTGDVDWRNPLGLLQCALLHDAPEYCLKDMVKPLKVSLPDFVQIEKNMEAVIFEKFNVDPKYMKDVKKFDNIAQRMQFKDYNEKRDIIYLNPEQALWAFLNRYNMYFNENVKLTF